MLEFLFILIIFCFTFIFIFWGYKTLPGENWQFMAVVPEGKSPDGTWSGRNLTFYGALSATASVFATTLFLILTAAQGIPLPALAVLTILLLGLCLPASSIVARLVEKKANTLTVGGAVFTGAITAPWVVLAMNASAGKIFDFDIPVPVYLSSVCVAYAFGEGLGRLACVSFGCCYGKPLDACGSHVQKLFSRFHLVFHGETRKIAYASGLTGQKVIPVQIITALLYCTAGTIGLWLYLNRFYTAALLLCLMVTQFWRFFSEFFRADFRGGLKISMYQVMALFTVFYAWGAVWMFPGSRPVPDLGEGLRAIWNPWPILMLQALWILCFLYTGLSQVTGARISFHVAHEKI